MITPHGCPHRALARARRLSCVIGVTTVQEALKALTANSIAWVITDLMMPTGDGMDILSYARTHHPQAKVIIMTAFGSDVTRQRALARGAHAFLSKPSAAKRCWPS